MRDGKKIAAIIPALNEERSLGSVLAALPTWIDVVVVADNGSTDRTAQVAAEHGARVVYQPRRGYGSACLAAIEALDDPDVVLFLDGDFSDRPQEADRLVDPIVAGRADMVLGSRVRGEHEPGALTPQAVFGNRLACRLIKAFWNAEFTDLGPFRAVRYGPLQRLRMRDPDYGWTVEMQIKAVMNGLRVVEVPVSYRRRIGKSKVSGTVRGVVGAGTKILGTIALAALGLLPGTRGTASEQKLIIFTRYPIPGSVKTRLIPVLGRAGAADLHRRMTEYTVHKMRRIGCERSIDVEISFDGCHASVMKQWLGADLVYHPQGDGDLGVRMLNAFRKAFRDGAERTLLVGTDCPELSPGIVERAFIELKNHDLVFGPAADGGYYLIGARRPHPDLFTNVPWGDGEVLSVTLGIAEDQRLSVGFVDTLHDIDRPEDIELWTRSGFEEPIPSTTDFRDGSCPEVSVIVPVLNEEEHICAALHSAGSDGRAEIIVVDGGSSDRTPALLRDNGVDVIHASGGRSRQMNVGARRSSGRILLFLHADTVLPLGWCDQVIQAPASPQVCGGAFHLRIDADLPGLRIVEGLANLRSRVFGMPYGDQAIFLRRETFEAIGGFPEIPLLEDLELVRKLRKLGRLHILPSAVLTSGRRWRNLGVWKTTAINQLVLLGHFLGIPIDNLARFYRRERWK
ncbi:MAG: TIGR04283 family arsenosugar biosynthesis glycosyltransferase [Desulfomonilaceae bacterium]|nr:TIGR04283 family arsenosugar biosynthesis glycosyltransferase [Desulfomonilaceae bacterium]